MKTSKKVLIVFFMLFVFGMITNIPNMTNVSQAAQTTNQTTKKYIGSKRSTIVVNTKNRVYTGKKITPKVTIYRGDKKLKNGKDYTVTYIDNKKIGKATIKIKGKGEYYGTIKKKFYIIPKKPTLYSVKVDNYNGARIHWKKNSKVDGYVIYMRTGTSGEYQRIKTIKDVNTTRYIKNNLDPDTKYYFKIKVYQIVNGRKVWSNYSNTIRKDLPSKMLSEVTLTASASTISRNHNIRLASNACNNTILRPGESFNWARIVGEAAAWKGYKEATIFVNKKPVPGVGGGVCQVSSTIYQAAKNAKLQIVERHTHSLPVTYTTTGKDATVAYGSKNLIFRNNKSYSVRIEVTSNGKSCTCKIYRM